MIPIFDSKRQYTAIGSEIEKAVCEVLRSGAYIMGPNVKALESELAKYIGCNYTVALNSGTDALQIALRALDIGAGDEVITVATDNIELFGENITIKNDENHLQLQLLLHALVAKLILGFYSYQFAIE